MSRRENLFRFEFERAVQASNLDPKIRYLLVTMASLADGHTGVGLKSQDAIAKAMGYSDRYVRDLIKEFEGLTDPPVKVLRTRRLDGDGYRAPDRYELSIVDPDLTGTPSSAKVGGPYRNKTPTLPEQNGDLTGTRCSALSDLSESDQSDLIPLRGKKGSKKVPVPEAKTLMAHYQTEFKRLRGEEPKFGKLTAKAWSAFGDLVSTHGLETAKRIVTNALGNPFTRPVEPWHLAASANGFLTAAPISKQTPRVQGGGWVEPEKSQKQKELDALAASLPG